MKRFPVFSIYLIICFSSLTLFAQSFKVNKIEPPNWWTGMQYDSLQLMVYGENLKNLSVTTNSQNVKVVDIKYPENSSYCFVDVILLPALTPGEYKIVFISNGEQQEIDFPVFEKNKDLNLHQGFDNSDVIYLITPDRFANGDAANDNVEGMIEGIDPENPLGRHGGDIKGIIDHFDYLKELGITTLWINPLVENNGHISYHGYAATDFYNIDARFGTNDLYKELVNEAHKRGLKVIMDHVSNHMGIDHPWMKNLPAADWIHGTIKNHLPAVHHKMVLSDVHGESLTKKYLQEGWFVDSMPDLNQKNPFVAKYIIQNTIWWLEFAGLDGIREDTYPYADQKFLANWAKTILEEYPELNIVGEVWTGVPAFLANYQTGCYMPREFDSNLPSVTDFGFQEAIQKYLKGKAGYYEIYQTFAMDYLYPDPDKFVTFVDNHDIARIMLAADEDIFKVKSALTLLLTTRGIPQILYATEIGMKGTEDHGYLRSDFPGGFPDDDRNAFTNEGRTEQENDIYNFVHRLLKLRKVYPALTQGKLVHYPPFNGNYVYLKSSEEEKILVILNDAEQDQELNLSLISSETGEINEIFDLFLEKKLKLSSTKEIIVRAHSINVLLLK